MATLAAIFSRFFTSGASTEPENVPQARQTPEDIYRLRHLPNEGIFFFVKEFDNSRVVREADPVAPRKCWKTIIGGCAAAILLIGILFPGAYNLMAGRQIEALRDERQKLMARRAALELEEARWSSPERLEKLAENQKFIDPPPGSVIYLPPSQESLALNVQR